MEELLKMILEEMRFQSRVLQKINENLIRQKAPCGQSGRNPDMMRGLRVVADMFRGTPIGAQMQQALKEHSEGEDRGQ